MTPFNTLTSMTVPLIRDNVDTDAIIPSREIRSTGRTGLAAGLFAPWRYLDSDARVLDPDFVLNDPAYRDAKILIGGANFGCGSSREHAVWALAEYGFRCVVAESFAPILYNNCVRNGLLPIMLARADIALIAGRVMTVDLPAQTLSSNDQVWHFDIGVQDKVMLVDGLDAIDLTLKHKAVIMRWRAVDKVARPWIYLGDAR